MKLLRPFLVVVVLVAASACGGGAEETEGGGSGDALESVSAMVTLPTEAYIVPWLAAREQELFADHGVAMGEFAPGEGADGLRAVAQGEVDIAELSFPTILNAAVEGVPVKVVGGGVQSPSALGAQFYALASNDEVNSIEDVDVWAYTRPGTVTHSLSFLIPEAAGVDPGSIKRVAAGGIGEGIALLEAGEVDIATVPTSLYLENPDKYKLIAKSEEYIPEFQLTAIVTSERFAEENGDLVRGVLASYAEGYRWVEENPEEAASLYAAASGKDMAVAKDVVDLALKTNAWSVGFDPKATEAAVAGLEATGSTGEVRYCDLFTTEFLPENAPSELPVAC